MKKRSKDRTTSEKFRAGGKQNKKLKNVKTFASDRKNHAHRRH